MPIEISETACYVGTNRGLYLIKGNKVVRCKIKDRSFGDNITDMSGDGKRIWVAGKRVLLYLETCPVYPTDLSAIPKGTCFIG